MSLSKAVEKEKIWESVKIQETTVRGISNNLEELSVKQKAERKSCKLIMSNCFKW